MFLSPQFVLETKWTSVPNLKKRGESVFEMLCLQAGGDHAAKWTLTCGVQHLGCKV